MKKLTNEFDQLQDVINDCQGDITKKEFEKLVKLLQDVNLENVIEETDETDLSGELACAGGSCEITSL
jgi:ribosomal protein L12E/L44/L45/RPP1/RPP2